MPFYVYMRLINTFFIVYSIFRRQQVVRFFTAVFIIFKSLSLLFLIKNSLKLIKFKM